MFTVPVATIALVIFPSTLSYAVAHASVYVLHVRTFIDELPKSVITGGVLSIRSTIAVALPVFPMVSINANVKLLLVVKICHVANPLFVTVTHGLLSHVKIAKTSQLVQLHELGIYSMFAVGLILSIRVTVAVTSHVFPASSINSNVKLPLSVKRYHVEEPIVLVTVIPVSLNHVKIAKTFQLVIKPGIYSTVAVGGIVS